MNLMAKLWQEQPGDWITTSYGFEYFLEWNNKLRIYLALMYIEVELPKLSQSQIFEEYRVGY